MGSLRLIISQVTGARSQVKMPKELMTLVMERDNLQQKWGLTIQGGADLALTAKIASVKRFSPADRAGLEKMDYVWTVNNNEVFKMTQKEITNEIVNSKLQLTLQVERGTFIVPSLTRSGLRQARVVQGTRGGRGWGWTIYWRPCSTTASATSRSRTTSPPVAGWA